MSRLRQKGRADARGKVVGGTDCSLRDTGAVNWVFKELPRRGPTGGAQRLRLHRTPNWRKVRCPVTALDNDEEPFCDESAIARVKRHISTFCCSNSGRQLAFLLLSGSFNPVHTQHIGALCVTKNYVESLGWTVVGGFLAPSSDIYVQGKLGSDALPLKRRIALCCLAIEGLDWLSVCVRGEMSSNWTCRSIRSELERNCFDILNGRCISGVEIMSSDVAVRLFPRILRKKSGRVGGTAQLDRRICCLIRCGPNSVGEKKYIENVVMPSAANLGVHLILVDPAVPLEPVSSSAIRELVANGDWGKLRTKGWLHPSVLKALQTTGS
jgi:hypothetical protein